MKLEKGITFHKKNKKYIDEVPDSILTEGEKKALSEMTQKEKQEKKEKPDPKTESDKK